MKNLKNKLYIISFDIYKEVIGGIFNDIIINILNISFITFSSLNNDNIGKYKLNLLFSELNTKSYIIYKEIKDLIDASNLE